MDALLILPTKELMNYWAEGRILFKALWHLKRDKKHLQNLSLSYTYYSFLIFYFMLFIWSCCTACGILVPQGGTELTPPALEAQSLNHWITREVPQFLFFWSLLLWFFFFSLQFPTLDFLFSSVSAMAITNGKNSLSAYSAQGTRWSHFPIVFIMQILWYFCLP